MFSDFLNSFRLEPGIWDICLRLFCAMIVGMIIGTEREYTNRPAGMRTHILVALGACVVALTGEMLFKEYFPLGATPDPARLAAQVITGVGFLGAGTIMREGATVKGLTTAASVWTVACMGIAAGFGYYTIPLIGLVFTFITLTILELLQHHLPGRSFSHEHYTIRCDDVCAGLSLVNELAKAHRADLQSTLAEKQDDGYIITFLADFPGIGRKHRREQFFSALAASSTIRGIQRNTEVTGSKHMKG